MADVRKLTPFQQDTIAMMQEAAASSRQTVSQTRQVIEDSREVMDRVDAMLGAQLPADAKPSS